MSIVGASVLHCPAKNSLVTQTPQMIVIISQMKEDENEGDKANCNEWRKNVHMHKHTHTHVDGQTFGGGENGAMGALSFIAH